MLGNERGILEFRNLGVAQEENRKQRDMRRELVDRRDRVARQGRARPRISRRPLSEFV
jgi:hypothetical protein